MRGIADLCGVGLSLTVAAVLVAFCVNAHDYNEQGWRDASKFLFSSMDQSKRACRDFYGYACGNWMASSVDHARMDELQVAELKLQDLLLDTLKRLTSKPPPLTPAYQKALAIINHQCLNLPVMSEKELLFELFNAVKNSGHIVGVNAGLDDYASTSAKVWHMAGYFEQMFMSHVGIEASADWVLVNCTRQPILKISYPTNPNLEVTSEELPRITNILFEAVLGLTLEELHQINETAYDIVQTTILSRSEEIINFTRALTTLAEAQRARRGNEEQTGTKVKLSALSERYPLVAWDAYLSALFPDNWANIWKKSDPEVIIVGDYYFKSIPSLLQEHHIDAIKDYAYWKLLFQIKAFYLNGTANGSAVASDHLKEHFCFEIMKRYAPAAVARTYFDILKADLVEWRNDVDLVAQNLLSAFRVFVSGQDWLDSRDKMTIISRINEIRINTGIPEWLSDEDEVTSRTPEFNSSASVLQNVVVAYRNEFRKAFAPLIDPNSVVMEPPPRLTVGSRYSYGKIDINMGQLLPPLYDIKYPLAVKYGTLGWLIGHELMHGFDEASLAEGLKQEGKSLLRDYSLKMFHQRKRCIVQQYSAYCYKKWKGKCLSGGKTVNENIGDIEGLKIAYMAYKFVTQTMGAEPPLPDFIPFSSDKIFFISAARLHCGKEQDFLVEDESFPPSKVRVDQSMRNFPTFAKTFHCIKGSKYAPIRTCSLWGRFVQASQCDAE